jgi:RecA-family ATPase
MDNEDRYRWAADYVDANREGSDTPSYPPIPPRGSLIARLDQRTTDRLTPKRVVQDYLFADVALLIGPGGTGKTALALWEAVHIVLGRPLYGLEVVTRGRVTFITGEDGGDVLFARLCAVMDEMGLSAQERDTVWAGIEIWDVTGVLCRLAELNRAGNVVLTGLADAIVEHFKDRPPVVLNLDPVISFGAGERLINDNEQALVLAARRIVRGLGCCCVRLICHTGKQAARDGALDQYSGRGGSALADGSRMVAVLRGWDADAEKDKLSRPPGLSVGSGEQVIVLARPKLSYAPPQPHIWITRRRYSFQYFLATKPDPEAEVRARADQVERYLIEQLAAGARHSQKTLEDSGIMPRDRARAALSTLMATGRVIYAPLPEEQRHGGRQRYLHPTKVTSRPAEADSGEVGQKSTPTSPASEPPSTSPRPYREKNGGEVEAAVFPLPSCHLAGEGWRGSGEVGEVGGNESAGGVAEDDPPAGPSFTKWPEDFHRNAAREPGYSKDAEPQYCCMCRNRAQDRRCLAWAQLGAREGWRPVDKAPRRCRGFVPTGEPCRGP